MKIGIDLVVSAVGGMRGVTSAAATLPFCLLLCAFLLGVASDLPCNGYVFVKDERNCSWFYRCDITGRSQHMQCYPGLFFNELINDCDLPHNVPECAEYPFLCSLFSLCWPPVPPKTSASVSNSSLASNDTQIAANLNQTYSVD